MQTLFSSSSRYGFRWVFICVLAASIFVGSCEDDPDDPVDLGDLSDIPYNPTPYTIQKPAHFPAIDIPANNPQTAEGVALGRMLFYDPILSADSTMSCSSCHLPAGNFTDNLKFSTGIDGIAGKRSSMALLNIAYANNGLFWDGRSATLEEQALRPVEDPIEMHNTWMNVVSKLKVHPIYPEKFRKAFGIADRSQISKELAAKAIAQFERILISSGNSKYDQYLATQDPGVFTEEELDGKIMYFDEGQGFPDAECFHCHGGFDLTGHKYFNNGLDSVTDYNDYIDKGRGMVTTNISDNGKFRAPSLRNIALSAPYMHDGRFQTLQEVIGHYNKGGFNSPGEDPFIHPLGFAPAFSGLTNYQKDALLKFLHTFTDTTFINRVDIQNPF